MLRYFLSIIALFILSVCLWVGVRWYQYFHTPLTAFDKPQSIKIYPNDHLMQVAHRLSKQHIIKDPHLFAWFVDVTGNRHRLHYGEYLITNDTTMWQLIQNMSHGQGMVKHRVMLVNGWRFKEFLSELRSHDALKQTLQGDSDKEIMKLVSGRERNPEGLFYPDTYFFVWGNTDLSVLKTAYQKMQNVLAQLWKERAPNLPYARPYDALIVASLIAREANLAQEKPLVASVIVNRLRKKMRLQIDPTVQYGLDKSFGSDITKSDLSAKTAYNTYTIDGLPPTPICMPGTLSIEAALHPANTQFLYYVATGNGGHRFSATYLEHKRAVKEYRNFESNMQKDVEKLKVVLKKSSLIMGRAILMMVSWPLTANAVGLV